MNPTSTAINLSRRDRETLALLSRTQLTAPLILKASEAFTLPEHEEPYRDVRRVRERLQRLGQAKLVRWSPIGTEHGRAVNCYRLTHEGFRTIGLETPLPTKTFFEPVAVSRQQHTLRLAEIVVHTMVTCHRHRIRIAEHLRENSLSVTEDRRTQYPDAFFRLQASGREFHFMIELDNSTEPLDSTNDRSIREKILTYEAHQERVLRWSTRSDLVHNPRFRVVFLTRSQQRAENIVRLACELARNGDRRLCYAATQDEYLAAADAVCQPLFLDHHGGWQSLVNVSPTSQYLRTPVRL